MEFKNRTVNYEYEIVETYTAGIVLKGCEVKAIRNGFANLTGTYCLFLNGELFVRGLEIHLPSNLNIQNISPKRDKKLLLTKRQLTNLQSKVATKGLTIVALKAYFNDNQCLKLDIALARGKKNYDRRNAIKERDLARASGF